MKKLFLLGVAIFTGMVNAQEFSVDADFRTRADVGYLNGNFQRVIGQEGDLMEGNVESRSRINIMYKDDKFELKFSPQDVRFWGADNSVSRGNTFLSLADAWLKYKFNKKSYLKVGRQPLSYDNQRLLGGLDWAMQGRFFEAVKYSTKIGESGKLDLAVTYNNDGIDSNDLSAPSREIYGNGDGGERTVSLQMLHYGNKLSDKASFTLIALNNVVQNTTGTHYAMQTFGINPKIIVNDMINLTGSAYYQTGKNSGGLTKNAFQYSANLNAKPTDILSFTLGGEVMSGDNNGNDINTSFSPLYGTNHAHNGYMDFFFVNNYFNNNGLFDGYLKTMFKLSDKSKLKANGHYFASQRDLGGDDKTLGFEADLVFIHKIDKNFTLQVGHSQFFADEDNFGGTNPEGIQSWSWAQLLFKPSLFKTKL